MALTIDEVRRRNRERLRAARAADPERFRMYAKRWEERNPERRAAINDRLRFKYRTEPDRQLRARRKARAWAMEHPERVKTNHKTWRERNKQQWARVVAIAGASYRKRHPERLRAIEVARKRAKSATPAWGDKAMMRTVYRKAREFGMEVDHIVPLKHPLVCGLHVWHNLQLLKRTENRSKNNRAWPDMPS